MHQAFNARATGTNWRSCCPQVRGHALEPWAAYWELKSRLDTATPQEIQDFFARYAGTYQEDRLRNDWLLLLGQRRDWTTFAAEYPKYRMNDDREVRCYALLVTHLREGASAPPGLAEEVRRNWLRAARAGRRLHARRLAPDRRWPGAAAHDGQRCLAQGPPGAWRPTGPRAAAAAVEIAAPEAVGLLDGTQQQPGQVPHQQGDGGLEDAQGNDCAWR